MICFFYRSQWWRNEFVRGGYSHITVNCDDDRINGTTLAQPAMTNIYRKDLVFEVSRNFGWIRILSCEGILTLIDVSGNILLVMLQLVKILIAKNVIIS